MGKSILHVPLLSELLSARVATVLSLLYRRSGWVRISVAVLVLPLLDLVCTAAGPSRNGWLLVYKLSRTSWIFRSKARFRVWDCIKDTIIRKVAENTRKHGLPKIAKTGSTTHSCLPILGNLLNVSQVVDYIRQQESYFIKIQKQSGLRFPVDTYVLNVVPGMSLCQLAYRIRGHPPTGQIEGERLPFMLGISGPSRVKVDLIAAHLVMSGEECVVHHRYFDDISLEVGERRSLAVLLDMTPLQLHKSTLNLLRARLITQSPWLDIQNSRSTTRQSSINDVSLFFPQPRPFVSVKFVRCPPRQGSAIDHTSCVAGRGQDLTIRLCINNAGYTPVTKLQIWLQSHHAIETKSLLFCYPVDNNPGLENSTLERDAEAQLTVDANLDLSFEQLCLMLNLKRFTATTPFWGKVLCILGSMGHCQRKYEARFTVIPRPR